MSFIPGLVRPPAPRQTASRARSALAALTLLAAGVLVALTASVVESPAAYADPAPPPPAGWTTVFSDDFAGPAGSAPAAANWFYDIGTGFGTGEKEHTTNSTDNVYLDGNGHLVLKAVNSGGTWTSGRIESTRSDFQAPPGGKMEMIASVQQPNPAGGLGYWPAFWALGAPMRTGGGWPQSGEIDMMEDVNALNEASQTLHTSGPSPGHALIPCPGAGSSCQTGYHTYAVIIDRTDTNAEILQFLMDGVVESTITEASVGVAAWQAAIDHGFFIIWDLAMGGNYPDGIQGSATPTAATTSGGTLSAAWVAVYEQGGNSTPTGTPTATGQVKGLNGLCLANQNSLNVASNPINVVACNGTAGQAWSPYTDGTLRTQGGCLDVVAAGKTSGTQVDWYPCNASAAQGWTKQANGTLVNPNSGLCLTVPGANTGSRLDIETCTGSAQQIWTLPGGGTGNTVTVTNPGSRTAAVGTATSLQIAATDSASGQTLTYGATGLPAGLSVNPTTGLISGTPTAAGTSSVTISAHDTTGASGAATFTWTVTGGTGGTCGTTDVALRKPVTGTQENAGTAPGNAVDGDTGTRWSSAFSDPQTLTVDLGQAYQLCKVVLNWEAAYATAYSVQVSADNATWTTIFSTTTGTGGVQALTVTGTGRYLRMNGTQRATQYGYSLWEFEAYAQSSGSGNTVTVTNPGNRTATVGTATSLQIAATDSAGGQTLTYGATGLPAGLSINTSTGLVSGTPTAAGTSTVTVTAQDTTGASGSTSFTWTVSPAGTCGTTNIAQGRPATASSQENAAFPAANAVDGNAGTRWSSAFADPQWLQVDLGSTQSICKVVLQWEAAYGKAYQIQTSPDGTTWTSIYSTTTAAGGTQTLNITGSGRYVRMYGTTRATQYGYSLLEFGVYAG
ncbi:discoidin domain-containing protein [Hamadaea tsunoensis]|uniref:discoidin domain-containing protein n=1 Tax=Hamadaea tsunoensis TaxID=53368 RepID=UPI00041A67A6|nr:discoidin domain-containing protein [Hamadaea tsunoensis]